MLNAVRLPSGLPLGNSHEFKGVRLSGAEVIKMVSIIEAECVACGACVDACPETAITVDDIAVIDADKCIDCGTCVDECPNSAITE